MTPGFGNKEAVRRVNQRFSTYPASEGLVQTEHSKRKTHIQNKFLEVILRCDFLHKTWYVLIFSPKGGKREKGEKEKLSEIG